MKNEKFSKKLIIFTHSGLCNRLLPLVSGLRAAELLERQLLFCWADAPRRTCMKYQGNEMAKFNDLFRNEISEITLEEVNGLKNIKWFTDNRGIDTPKTKKWAAPKGLKLENPEVIISDTIPNNLEDDIIIVRRAGLFGVEGDNSRVFSKMEKDLYSPSSKFVVDIRPYFRLLKPVERISNIIEKHKVIMPDSMIGFHIRRTDFKPSNPFKGKKGKNKQIAEIIDRTIIQRQATKLYLSTDCMETEKWFKKYYGKMLMVYKNNKKFENSKEGTIHALVDLYLLSQTQWIFGTFGSTFSEVAWLLSRNAQLAWI